MALKRNERYPGRFSNPTTAHPQGAFKNRTAPNSQDGSYLEQDWANDWDGFFSSLLSAGGVTPNGNVDAVGASQYYTALGNILRTISNGVVGDARNLTMSVPTSAASATLTADQVIVAESLTGKQYRVNNVSKTINLGTTGAGGMDTGTAPNPGFVAIYLIYNPTTDVSALLATNATSSAASTVYSGANMPSGYTASALVSVWRTSSGSFTVGHQAGNNISTLDLALVTPSSNVSSLTLLNISSAIPLNAKSWSGYGIINSTASAANCSFSVAPTSGELGLVMFGTGNSGLLASFSDVTIVVPQTTYYRVVTQGTFANATIHCTGYKI